MPRAVPLAVLLFCAFAVTVDTTLVNVALPTLSRELEASTRELQWVVDGYTITFAALVLAMGALGDRFGRRRLLLIGLGVYGAGNGAAALVDTSEALVACRAVMGVGAALIFPATLSTIVYLYTERAERAKAIGLWGATTGLAVALGPIIGGAMIEASGWPATFWLKVPLVVVATVLVLMAVPESRDEARPPVDRVGLLVSSLGVLLLVWSVIEAPEAGWLSAQTVGGIGASVVLLTGFVLYEQRSDHPLLDISLFRSGRFSAAALAVTVAFFALFGFIFLITQYFQLLRGYGPLETGVRLLPVAISTGVASIVGTALAVRLGNKVVVATGLLFSGVMFAWTSQVSGDTSYLEIAAQMVLLGTGMGLTAAPATESIMGTVPEAKLGVGSGVNDTTRELGGTLGVAIIGSVFASLYNDALKGAPAVARDSLAGALQASEVVGGQAGLQLRELAASGFYEGLEAGCLVAAGIALVGAAIVAVMLPAAPAP